MSQCQTQLALCEFHSYFGNVYAFVVCSRGPKDIYKHYCNFYDKVYGCDCDYESINKKICTYHYHLHERIEWILSTQNVDRFIYLLCS